MTNDAWRVADPRLDLALRETWKALDFQREHLGEIRNRIGGALTLTTVAFALVNRTLLTPGGHLRGWGIPPAIGIVLLFAAVLFTAWPRSWAFIRRPARFEQFWVGGAGAPLDQMLSNLYRDACRDYAKNAGKLQIIEIVYTAAIAVLGLTLGSLVIALIWAK